LNARAVYESQMRNEGPPRNAIYREKTQTKPALNKAGENLVPIKIWSLFTFSDL